MPLTISTPYKSGTLASVSGATFNSNGTPFAAGDVGRCIVMTSGAAAGCIRRITGFVDSDTVTLDMAWGVSPFAAVRNVATGLPFAESAPAAGDTWVMSHVLDDIDNGTDLIKASTDAYTIAAAVTLSSGVFLYDAAKVISGNFSNFRPASGSYVRFGDISVDGYGKRGCAIIDSLTATTGISGTDTNGNSGDLHLYGCNVDGASSGTPFWRMYRGSSHIVRMVDCRFSRRFGMRAQGTQSLLLRVSFDDNANTIGPFNTITPFGAVRDIYVRDGNSAAYWFPGLGNLEVRGVSATRITTTALAINVGFTAVPDVTAYLRDVDAEALSLLPAAYTIAGAAITGNSSINVTNSLAVTASDVSLSPVADSVTLCVEDSFGTQVLLSTQTSGDFGSNDVLIRRWTNGAVGSYTWASGTGYGDFSARLLSYGWRDLETTFTLARPTTWAATLLPDNRVAASSAAAALAVSGITVTETTVTITANVTVQQVFDFAKATRVANPGWPNILPGDSATDFGALDFDVAAGVTLTGSFTTTGTVTLGSGASVSGVYTDSTGTHTTITAASIVAGSRVQLYSLTDSTELLNTVLASTGLTYATTWTADKTIRLRADHPDYLPLEATGILSASGLQFLVAQEADTVYIGNGIDGSAVTEFAADGLAIHVDVDDPDGYTLVQRLYAWMQHFQTTEAGIASEFFGAMTASDSANYQIDQDKADIHLDNVAASPLMIVGGYLTRKDGSTVIAATSGSIQMDPGRAYVAPGGAAITVPEGERVVTLAGSGAYFARG